MLLPMIASSVMAINMDEREITKQPTVENPTVEVNDKDGASYQWYEVTSGEITDKNAKGFEYLMLSGKAEYNSEKGWSSAYLQIGESYYSHYFFEVEINEGETLFVEALSNFIAIRLYDASIMQEAICDVVQTGTGYLFSNISAEKIVVEAISDSSEAYIKAVIEQRQKIDTALENETGATLNSFEFGKSYACVIEWEDGTELLSNTISFVPGIITQPTGDNPKVEASFKDYAKFEWYNVINEAIDVTDENAEAFVYGSNEVSSYDKEKGWTPVENIEDESIIFHYYFTVDLKEGDIFKINTDLVSEEIMLLDMSKLAVVTPNENGELEVSADGSYILLTTNGSGQSVKAQILRGAAGDKIDGQDTNELTSYEPNKRYICKIAWTKGESSYEAYSNVIKTEYAIITEPTPEKMTIDVTFKDLVEKYEWFKGNVNEIEITDEKVTVYENASYSQENGWIGASGNLGTSYFQIELNKGDTLVLTHDTLNTLISDFYLDGEISVEAQKGANGEHIFEIERDGVYELVSNPDYNMVNVRVMLLDIEPSDTPIENQDSEALTEYEIGEYYMARVTYKDGATLESKFFKMKYAITSHPTNKTPTVETNKNADVIKYAWYIIEKLGLYDVIHDGGIRDGAYIPDYVYSGQYDGEQWAGSGYINILISLNKGDALKITLNEDFDGYVGHYNGDISFDYKDGSYYYTAETGEQVDFEIEDTSGKDIYAVIEVIRGNDVYNVKEKNAFDDKNGIYISPDVDEGYYDNGKWISESESTDDEEFQQIDVEFELDGEYKITVKLDTDFDGEVIIDDMSGDFKQELEIKDGVAIFENDGSINNIELNIESEDNISAEIILTYNGKDYIVAEEIAFNEEEKTYTDVYINDGAFADGLWMNGGEDNEIDLEIDLEKGSTLIITVSEGFEGEVYLDDVGYEPIYLEGKDGVYTYIASEAISPDVQIYNNDKDFSAKIQIERGKSALLEDQTTKTLLSKIIGKYYVEVTFENGETLVSNIFDINNQVEFDTNGGTWLDAISTMKLTEIAKTQRVGFILEGWYLDEELTQKVSLPLDVVGAVTLYAKWTVCDHKDSTEKATCTENVTCTVCGGKYEAVGHNYSLDYAKNENSHYYECTVCGNKKNEGEHTFSEWTVTKFPERTTQGEQKQVCTVCSYTVTRSTEALGGLSAGATVFIIVASGAVLSALAVGIWFILRKKF